MTPGRDPGIFLAFFLRRRFDLSSLIYEGTVPIRPEDHVELLLHQVKQKELARYIAPGDRTDFLTLYVDLVLVNCCRPAKVSYTKRYK